MTTAKVEKKVVEEQVQPATDVKQTQITAQDLQYLYAILVNASIPSRDAAFVVQLQNKLQETLGIK